eukprot:6077071-Pleurochrysis_carterae.AAC.1
MPIFVNSMLDIDYLGEVNYPNGLPGLSDQAPRICQAPGGERGREMQNTAVSSQFTTLLLLKILGIFRHPERPPTERALK